MPDSPNVGFAVFDATDATWPEPRGDFHVRSHPSRPVPAVVTRVMGDPDGTWLQVESRGPEALGARHNTPDVDARFAAVIHRVVSGTAAGSGPQPERRDITIDGALTQCRVVADADCFALATQVDGVRIVVSGRFPVDRVALSRVITPLE